MEDPGFAARGTAWKEVLAGSQDRQISSVTDDGKTLGMTHNLGGAPGECVSFVSVVGSELG